MRVLIVVLPGCRPPEPWRAREDFKQESHREETLGVYRQAHEAYARIAAECARTP